jgi:16S rRNA (guanine527-N7)-methyltransferase
VEPFHVELRGVLQRGLEELGLRTDPGSLDRWQKLAVLLERWSERINLTGHRGGIAIAERLLLEAAALIQVLPAAGSVVDLGSGAGIPGIPLAICRPDCGVRLIESRERRHHFQRAAIRELDLDNATPLLGRAEVLEVQPSQGVIAQAIAQPEQAIDWMRRWMAPRGWIALATVPSAAGRLRHPDLVQEQVLRYAAPRGPERAVWIARGRDPEPSS